MEHYTVGWRQHCRVGNMLLMWFAVIMFVVVVSIFYLTFGAILFVLALAVVGNAINGTLHCQYTLSTRGVELVVDDIGMSVFKWGVEIYNVDYVDIETVERYGPFSPTSWAGEYYYFKVRSGGNVLYVNSLLCDEFPKIVGSITIEEGSWLPFLPTIAMLKTADE